jgi:hypothetical protein
MNEIEDIEGEYDSIIRIMEGMKFYDIYAFSTNFGISTFCTYRDHKQISEVFDNKLNVVQLEDPDAILESFEGEGIFCLELHNNYKSLKSLAEDLIVSRISGMMDKEMTEEVKDNVEKDIIYK